MKQGLTIPETLQDKDTSETYDQMQVDVQPCE